MEVRLYQEESPQSPESEEEHKYEALFKQTDAGSIENRYLDDMQVCL